MPHIWNGAPDTTNNFAMTEVAWRRGDNGRHIANNLFDFPNKKLALSTPARILTWSENYIRMFASDDDGQRAFYSQSVAHARSQWTIVSASYTQYSSSKQKSSSMVMEYALAAHWGKKTVCFDFECSTVVCDAVELQFSCEQSQCGTQVGRIFLYFYEFFYVTMCTYIYSLLYVSANIEILVQIVANNKKNAMRSVESRSD